MSHLMGFGDSTSDGGSIRYVYEMYILPYIMSIMSNEDQKEKVLKTVSENPAHDPATLTFLTKCNLS